MDKIRHIPTVIVQGRYDLVCPFYTAWALHKVGGRVIDATPCAPPPTHQHTLHLTAAATAQAFPEAEFRVIPNAGHSAYEPGITSALIEATDKFRYT